MKIGYCKYKPMSPPPGFGLLGALWGYNNIIPLGLKGKII